MEDSSHEQPTSHPEDSTFMGSIFNNPPNTSRSLPSSSSHLSARDILNDLDYESYLTEPSNPTADVVRQFAERAIWKYSSVFLAQPFDVAKTILQVQYNGSSQGNSRQKTKLNGARKRNARYRGSSEELSSDSDPESYFSPATPSSQSAARKSRSRRRRGSSSSFARPGTRKTQRPTPPSQAPHALDLKSPSSLTAVLNALWNKEGAWGVWKGTNSTYVYSILLSTLTSFSRSFLAAVFSLPDPGLTSQFSAFSSQSSALGKYDILTSESPAISLAIAVSAAGLASIILSPLDIARTKLILTPSTHPPRSVMSALTSLSSWTIPLRIAPATLLHSVIPSFIATSLPLFLRRNLGIDPLTNSNLYSVGTATGQIVELAIKLPLETVLRRGQMQITQSHAEESSVEPVVGVGGYNGVLGTMYDIVYNEGERTVISKPQGSLDGPRRISAPSKQVKKGQGFEGLWRGWRVGMWGLVGLWGATSMGPISSRGGEF